MLKLTPEAPETITEEIEITVPGQKKTAKLSLTFQYRNKTEYAECMKACKDRGDTEIIMDICAGWDGIDAEFSKENVAIFLDNYPAASSEIVVAYGKALFRSRVKN